MDSRPLWSIFCTKERSRERNDVAYVESANKERLVILGQALNTSVCKEGAEFLAMAETAESVTARVEKHKLSRVEYTRFLRCGVV